MADSSPTTLRALPKAVIYGTAGLSLTAEEKSFFASARPAGFILFARNCESPGQIITLIDSLKEVTRRNQLLVLIDQEGGRVARLKHPQWRAAPPAGSFADLAGKDLESAKQAVYLNARLIAKELFALGINVNCAPMIDLLTPGAHNIIGDRAFGATPEQVTALAEEMARGLMDGGVLPVIKHIPGHGRASVDSHEHLPVVNTEIEELRQTDFVPFRSLAHLPFAMTAHILYSAIDKDRVATLSPSVIQLIRNEIGFQGILLSDDISMKALSGDIAALSKQSLDAGCDIVLHCNGKMDEMQAIDAVVPDVTEACLRKLDHAFAMLKAPSPFDYADAEARVNSLIAVA